MVLGILAVIQVVFLPGYLALCVTRMRTESPIETAVGSFALSLLLNYLFVYLMSALGVYSRLSVFLLIAAEGLLVVWLVVRALNARESSGLVMELDMIEPDRWTSIGITMLTVIALCGTVVAALKLSLSVNVFDSWDALVSWNQWAYLWTSGEIPANTGTYPHLIPTNWSMMYLITGSREMQMFPVGIMPLFGLAIPLMFFDLGLRKKRLGYFLGLILCLFLAWQTRSALLAPAENAFLGYIDVPVTFMTAAAFYLLELRDDRRPGNWRELLLPLLIACAASVTKLNGFFVLGVVLLLAVAGHWTQRQALGREGWAKSGLLGLLALLAVPGSWYAFKIADFASGRDASGFGVYSDVTAAAAGGADSILTRLTHAASMFPWPREFLIAMAVAVALGVITQRTRWVILGILAPYTLLWANYLSYDLRNWYVMLPIAAYAAALGVGELAEKWLHIDMNLVVSRARFRVAWSTALIVIGLGLLCLTALSVRYPASTLVARSLEQQRLIGNPELNAALYEAAEQEASIGGNLLTDYVFLQFLPGFRSDPYRLDHTYRTEVSYIYHGYLTFAAMDGILGNSIIVCRNGRFQNCESLTDGWDYLLLSDTGVPEIVDLVKSRIADGSYTVIMEYASEPFMAYAEPVTLRLIRVNKPQSGTN